MKLFTLCRAAAATLFFALPALGQVPPLGYVQVNGTYIGDSSGAPVANATIAFAPVNNAGQPISYQVNGSGHSITSPVTALVTNGVFAIRLADTTLTKPVNVCFSVTVKDNVNGKSYLGPGYTCFQPAGSGTAVSSGMCTAAGGTAGGTCNFDKFEPSMPGLVTQQTGPTGPPGAMGPTGPPGGSLSYPGVVSDGANGVVVSGTTKAVATSSSVNSVINVAAPPYNAKGDNGTTDNTTVITNACNAAKAFTPPAQIYFPKASGYYLTGTLEACAGVSIMGQPGMSLALASGGVIIRGKPGQDIIHFHDPNTGTGTAPPRTWDISNINFVVDDSVDASASFPHRVPGRTTQDGNITTGTKALTSAKQLWYCSDIGSAIKVTGAGPSGANLITTIASIANCSGPQASVTLTDAASTTVTGALVYTSIPGLSATQTIGNCAIAADNFDGDSTHYAAGWASVSPNSASLHSVTINSVSGASQRNSCGIFFQGTYGPYGFHADQLNIYRIVYGVVQAVTDTNPNLGVAGQDQQLWSHVNMQVTYPWISYNIGYNQLSQWQLASAYGPLILDVGTGEGFSVVWEIQIPEHEQATGIAWIIRGVGHHLRNTQLVAANSKTYVDGSGITCDGCVARATVPSGSNLILNGSGNKLDFRNAAEGLFAAGATVDNGANNNVTISLMASPGTGGQPSRVVAASPTRTPGFVGSRTPDFAMGNPSTPYYNNQDLLFYPRDYKFNGSPYAIVTDATSFSGRYVAITASDASRGFTAFQATGGTPVVGQNVPASVITIYETAKCPVQTSYTLNVRNSVSGTPIGTGTFPCTTTYTTNSIVADLSTHNGESLWINWTGVTNEVDSAMIVITPYSVSATPGKNTVPKTVAASTTLDPGWLPFPASATIGGVKAQTCTGVNHVLGVNTDGSLNCTPDSGGGTTVNTMGCLQGFDTTPCVIAKVGTTYSNTVSSSTTTWYTNATGGPIHVRFTGIAHPTVVGTAGTMQLQLGVPSASNQCAGNGSITLTATTTKTTSSANTNGCLVTLQNGESLTWTLVLTGATGTPTVEVFAYAERME